MVIIRSYGDIMVPCVGDTVSIVLQHNYGVPLRRSEWACT